MFTTAKDWLERFTAAGGSMQVDAGNMYPPAGTPITPECAAIWKEIQDHENLDKWNEVHARVQALVGPITGWADFPPRRQEK